MRIPSQQRRVICPEPVIIRNREDIDRLIEQAVADAGREGE